MNNVIDLLKNKQITTIVFIATVMWVGKYMDES